jgi:hypothetical protein
MNPRAAAILARQHGLILRWQALRVGLAAREVDRLVSAGAWVAVRRGVYTTTLLWETLDEYVGRPLLRARAASLNMKMPHALSHDSAALAHGLEILVATPELVHVTRHGVLGSRTKHGVKHHLAPHRPDQLLEIDGLWVLDQARTVVDVAREHGRRHGVVVADAYLRRGFPRSELWDAVEPMRFWPGVTEARQTIELADGRAESPLESLGRLFALELGEGEVEPQFGLTDGRRTVWCDLRIGRHVIELDGRAKYRPRDRGGLATDPDSVLWEEKRRQDFICGFKLGMSRLTFVDLLPRNWEQSQRRVLRELRDTRARFGSRIDDLAPYLVRRPV